MHFILTENESLNKKYKRKMQKKPIKTYTARKDVDSSIRGQNN